MSKGGTALTVLLLLAGCSPPPYPWLDELDPEDGLRSSGERLMTVPYGLHLLEKSGSGSELLIGVHGFRSEGYEWVYPLKTMNGNENQVAFFRWDYNSCPGPAAEALIVEIEALVDVDRVRVIGHSLGGLVLAEMIDRWQLKVPLEVHIVASPLRLISKRQSRCGFELPELIPATVTVHEWRTVQAQDGAFRDLPEDPQNVDMQGSRVTRLPAEYQGTRLGHNWSLSWVADQLTGAIDPAMPDR